VIVARSVAEMRAALRGLPRPLGLVPTMGALHEGHLSLVAAARARCAGVAASLFVNPSQFGPGEDLASYPRDEERDLRLFEDGGVGAVFAPAADEMYPESFATSVHVGGTLTETLEGEWRGAHFDGVAAIVTKLLNVARPDVAFFGEKDAQQLAVVRRLVRDLDLPTEVAGVPTVREPDGLALSSRNAYLTPAQRAVAPDLYRALLAGRAAGGAPAARPQDVIAAAAAALVLPGAELHDQGRLAEPGVGALTDTPRFAVDYVAVVDADTFEAEPCLGPRSLLVVAARLGTTRLIDNLWLGQATPAEPAARPPRPETSAYSSGDATA